MEILTATMEQIRGEISRFCSEKRAGAGANAVLAQQPPVPAPVLLQPKKNLLYDWILEILKTDHSGITVEKMVESIKKKGFKVSEEDLQKIKDPSILVLNGKYYWRNPGKKVYFTCHLKENRIKEIVPDVITIKTGIYQSEISNELLELYRKFKGSDKILDEDVERILSTQYTPQERLEDLLVMEFLKIETPS